MRDKCASISSRPASTTSRSGNCDRKNSQTRARFASMHAFLTHGDIGREGMVFVSRPASLKERFPREVGRKQQLANTTVAHVNTSTWTITWAKKETKAKHDHTIALDGRALDLVRTLLAHRPLHCRHLLHGRRCEPGHVLSKRYACIGDIKKAWRSAVERAGFTVGRADGFVWHNTRHSAVTNLTNAGVPRHEAKTVSGHVTDSVFDRYSIGTEQQQRAAPRCLALHRPGGHEEHRGVTAQSPLNAHLNADLGHTFAHTLLCEERADFACRDFVADSSCPRHESNVRPPA